MNKLKYLSIHELNELYKNIVKNLERYRVEGFSDLAEGYGWGSELSVKADLTHLENLDPTKTPEAEVANSLTVWKALHDLTQALACEDRFWTRLTHIEGFAFSKERWFKNTGDDQKDANAIRLHFFAGTLNQCRDDNALARLWWNAYIAQKLRPNDQKGALTLLLKTADIRQALVERSRTMSRDCLGEGILRAMEEIPWLTESEINFREFMKLVNRKGGGWVFEAQSKERISVFMEECAMNAEIKLNETLLESDVEQVVSPQKSVSQKLKSLFGR